MAFIMGSSVRRTVAALFPMRIWSLSTDRSTGLLESTAKGRGRGSGHVYEAGGGLCNGEVGSVYGAKEVG